MMTKKIRKNYPVDGRDCPAIRFSKGWQFKKISFEDGEFSKFSKYLNSIAVAEHTGQTVTIKFKGQAIGFYDVMCSDGGRFIVFTQKINF